MTETKPPPDMLYVLDQNYNPVKARSWEEFHKFSEQHSNRVIGFTVIDHGSDDGEGRIFVSTVFLSTNHSLNDNAPLFFETMIFGGEHDEYQERYATFRQAVEGHKKAYEIAKESYDRNKI